jgi:peptidyl-prolyl cis-trans isomerase B (cyclophilin B)
MFTSIQMFRRCVFTSLLLILACNSAVAAATQQQQPLQENASNELAAFAGLLKRSSNPVVTISTNKGDIVIELFEEEATQSVRNFLYYVNSGYYTDTIFHRVIPNFMVQGGGFTESMRKKPGLAETIENEADNGLKNERGTLAMARTQDPHSATSQFFINTKDNDFLDFKAKNTNGWGYAVFGRVIQGMDIVDAIEGSTTTTKSGYQNVPKQTVIMEGATQLR